MAGVTDVTLVERGATRQLRVVPGCVSVHPSHDRPIVRRVVGSSDMLVLRIDGQWQRALDTAGWARTLEYRAPGKPHAAALELARLMCDEVLHGTPHGALYAESLSIALLSAIARTLPTTTLAPVSGNLSTDQQRAVRDYFDDHLQDDIRVADLAALCGVSERQLTVLFRRAFGSSPYRYVIDRRIERGALELTRGRRDIDGIACAVGFSSGSHFARELRRKHGISPRAFARSRAGS
jgi:AraC family transcriptional regulator